jgi:hypothetical protein
MLCGVFQGTVGGVVGSGAEEACRRGAILRRHCTAICGRERPKVTAIRDELIISRKDRE